MKTSKKHRIRITRIPVPVELLLDVDQIGGLAFIDLFLINE